MNNGKAERRVLQAAHGSRPSAPAEEGRSIASARAERAAPRGPYDPPELEALGRLRALTLQQTVPIGPGD